MASIKNLSNEELLDLYCDFEKASYYDPVDYLTDRLKADGYDRDKVYKELMSRFKSRGENTCDFLDIS